MPLPIGVSSTLRRRGGPRARRQTGEGGGDCYAAKQLVRFQTGEPDIALRRLEEGGGGEEATGGTLEFEFKHMVAGL